ncbi:thioredoxin family protein [Flavobacteriaceae bacterium]|nr:thioredoxin family protein [Flavobacteriaceae bacterium]
MNFIKQLLFGFIVLLSLNTIAQVHDPVQWETNVITTNEGTWLESTAIIEDGWHLYSQFINEGGPIPTTFNYGNAPLEGKTIEESGTVVDDPIFEMSIKYFSGTVVFKQLIKNSSNLYKLEGSVEYMVCNDEMCLPPKEVTLNFNIPKTAALKDANTQDKGMIMLFVLSFLAGLSALFTPCVFPMIPMTVSFFTKQSKNRATGIRNAIFYGVSIIVIYVLLGTAVVGIFGADALNRISTSVVFNIVFFVVLVFFAFSFLGFYDLVLPSSWGTKLDEKADKGGLVGIFFMAMALAVVSFSCTGPIVGTALVEAASKGGFGPIVAMLGFSSAIALPFTLFAIFPGWMSSLPKSGGWLNVVKVVLGFLELALAFKFLSNADLVLQTHYLEREVFVIIWMLVFLALSLYLFGLYRLPHDYEKLKKLSIGRLLLALASLGFVIYMIPGLFGKPLKAISAFVPPISYGLGSASNHSENLNKEGWHYFAPYKIISFEDYNSGLAYAKKHNKPVLLDFTGRACVNCRKMEEQVWSNPAVLKVLENDLVLISLHVDDRRALIPEEISKKTGKPFKYIGQKWSEFQELRYKTNAQPYYIVLDANGKDLNSPIGYTPNATEYLEWLKDGINSK